MHPAPLISGGDFFNDKNITNTMFIFCHLVKSHIPDQILKPVHGNFTVHIELISD